MIDCLSGIDLIWVFNEWNNNWVSFEFSFFINIEIGKQDDDEFGLELTHKLNPFNFTDIGQYITDTMKLSCLENGSWEFAWASDLYLWFVFVVDPSNPWNF